jgi:hypothetical protein
MVMSGERALGARAGELNRGASCVATIAAAGILQRESNRTRARVQNQMNPRRGGKPKNPRDGEPSEPSPLPA